MAIEQISDKSGEHAIVVFRFEDIEEAVATSRAAGAKALEPADVQRLQEGDPSTRSDPALPPPAGGPTR